MRGWLACVVVVVAACQAPNQGAASTPTIVHDAKNRQIAISDGTGNLILRLRYEHQCTLDSVRVGGREVVREDTGVCSAVKVGGAWFTTRAGIETPAVDVTNDTVTVTGIRFGGGGASVVESWRFEARAGGIEWTIERECAPGVALEDSYQPGFDFADMSTWTGALLGTGGVAWCRLFDAPNASYGVHTGDATYWRAAERACLRIEAEPGAGQVVATRFSRQPSGVFSANLTISAVEMIPKNGLSRFLHDRQDVWRPFEAPARSSVRLVLSAPSLDEVSARWDFVGIDGAAVRAVRDTIARAGVIDMGIIGSNSYYSDCAVLHEPWIAQMGILIDDPNYLANMARMIDLQRERAVAADGRVKSRWAGGRGDDAPGTYDANGFYETSWGLLMDSQPSWVINVAELFDQTADLEWLRRQKGACEAVLEYLLRRDSDGDGLVEMENGFAREGRASDWLDVVWASHENALVNAQMYWALGRWAECEDLLGDAAQSQRYRAAAAKLKESYNRPTADGGFWDPNKKRYVHWLDKDGAPHGNNLVVPVQFSAIGYGICDDPARRAAILEEIEAVTRREGLFFWPVCAESYAPGEASPSQYPFPNYENGDLFLAWGELGVRAYAASEPEVALRVVRAVLARHAADGLVCQRYLRRNQAPEGVDILANNASALVGLLRDIVGIQPKWNRLYLEPHAPAELAGTRLDYWLRGVDYGVELGVEDCALSAGGITLRAAAPFGVSAAAASAAGGRSLEFFAGSSAAPALTIRIEARGSPTIEARIDRWDSDNGARAWTLTARGAAATARLAVHGLTAGARYSIVGNGEVVSRFEGGRAGEAALDAALEDGVPRRFEIRAP